MATAPALGRRAASAVAVLVLVLGRFAAPVVAGVAELILTYDNDCHRPGTAFFPLLNNAGNCSTVAPSSNFMGVNATYMAFGCTLTIYSDPYCTYDATEVAFNTCGRISSASSSSSDMVIGSFSVDLCLDVVASDWNGPNASATTSVIAPYSTSTAHDDGISLSTGALVGVVVGAVIGFISLVLAAFFFMWRWRKRRLASIDPAAGQQPAAQTTQLEMEGSTFSPQSEKDQQQFYFTSDPNQYRDKNASELDYSHQRFELEEPIQDPREYAIYELDSQQYAYDAPSPPPPMQQPPHHHHQRQHQHQHHRHHHRHQQSQEEPQEQQQHQHHVQSYYRPGAGGRYGFSRQ